MFTEDKIAAELAWQIARFEGLSKGLKAQQAYPTRATAIASLQIADVMTPLRDYYRTRSAQTRKAIDAISDR